MYESHTSDANSIPKRFETGCDGLARGCVCFSTFSVFWYGIRTLNLINNESKCMNSIPVMPIPYQNGGIPGSSGRHPLERDILSLSRLCQSI